MPISITCPECKKKLQAPDSTAGKKIRCAGCKTIISVPAPDDDLVEPDEELVAPDDDLAEPEKETGVTEKPTSSPKKKKKAAWDDKDDEAPKSEDDGGYGIDADDQKERKRRKKRHRERVADDYDDYQDRRQRNRGEPHRGVLIMVLGISSCVGALCCPLLGWILAAVTLNMANSDSPKMERGLMDPGGQSMVTAGQICAYLGILLGLANCVAGGVLKSMGRI